MSSKKSNPLDTIAKANKKWANTPAKRSRKIPLDHPYKSRKELNDRKYANIGDERFFDGKPIC